MFLNSFNNVANVHRKWLIYDIYKVVVNFMVFFYQLYMSCESVAKLRFFYVSGGHFTYRYNLVCCTPVHKIYE